LGNRTSEAASIDGVWAYGRNFSVSELGRGHVIRNVHKCILSGAIENARHENAAQGKLQGWKMQEWKMRHKSAGLENARLENVAQKCRT